jgi:hypothetical protein
MMKGKSHLGTIDIALVSVFCALWATLNLTLGPLGFAWFGLPIFCDFAVFFTLLLVTWLTGRFGTASLVGIIGSVIVLLTRATPHIIGFAVSAILFDTLMFANHHKIKAKARSIAIAASATALSAYFAGVIIGIFFSNRTLDQTTLQWALAIWGVWHLIGGIISILIALPIIGILERAQVRKIKSA